MSLPRDREPAVLTAAHLRDVHIEGAPSSSPGCGTSFASGCGLSIVVFFGWGLVAYPFILAAANHVANFIAGVLGAVMLVLVATIWIAHLVEWLRGRRPRSSRPSSQQMRGTRFRAALAALFVVVVGVGLMGAFVSRAYVWEWWRDGERFQGTVTDVRLPEAGSDENYRLATITSPEAERSIVVRIGRWPWNDWKAVGDEGTAVLMPGDRSKVASPGDLQSYVLVWASLPLLTALWLTGGVKVVGRIVRAPWSYAVPKRRSPASPRPGTM